MNVFVCPFPPSSYRTLSHLLTVYVFACYLLPLEANPSQPFVGVVRITSGTVVPRSRADSAGATEKEVRRRKETEQKSDASSEAGGDTPGVSGVAAASVSITRQRALL